MDRGPRVPGEIRLQIASTYLELRKKNPKIKAPAVREAIRCRLKKVPYPGWPGLSVVQKVITDIRKKEADPLFSRQDEPWCLASLDEYPLSPEALKVVCEVWESELNDLINSEISDAVKSQMLRHRPSTNLTIREVKWIARLYKIIKEDKVVKPMDRASRLFTTADLYARAERLHQLLGIPFESDEMDRHLILGIPKLIKVNSPLLGLLIFALMEEQIPNVKPFSINSKFPISLDPILIDGKVPGWLIPLICLGGTEEALELMKQQKRKKRAADRSTKEGTKK
jgi:hypothetical protein